MIEKLSDYLKVSNIQFKQKGIFNAILGFDSRLFVDPKLLEDSSEPEFKNARQTLLGYHATTIKLIKTSKNKGDQAWKAAKKRLLFPEVKGVSIGYGHNISNGNAVGPVLGQRLLEAAKEIIELEVDDPEILELIGLFQEGFGPDRLSDMTIFIIREQIYEYTVRMCRELKILNTQTIQFHQKFYKMPLSDNGTPILLLPEEILNKLPLASDRSEIDSAISEADRVKDDHNVIAAAGSRQGIREFKAQMRRLISNRNREKLKALVKDYREASAVPYDFSSDPDSIQKWLTIAQGFTENYPISLPVQPVDQQTLLKVVDSIIKQFTKLIEENGMWTDLYDQDGKPRKEAFSQRVFFGIADAYCTANNLDLTREPNAGNGPVDFKLSHGKAARVLVELKLSTNRLEHGFETQLTAYQNAEDVSESIFLIIGVSDDLSKATKLSNEAQAMKKNGIKCPSVYLVDGRKKKSASKRKRL